MHWTCDSWWKWGWALWTLVKTHVSASLPLFSERIWPSEHCRSQLCHSHAGKPTGLPVPRVCLQISPLCPGCSPGGCTLRITYLQLTRPLAFIRFGQWEALAADQRVRVVSTSGSEFPPTLASFLSLSQAQLCSGCNPWHRATVPPLWDGRAPAHTNTSEPLPALLQTWREWCTSCWCRSLLPSLGSWLNLAHTFFFFWSILFRWSFVWAICFLLGLWPLHTPLYSLSGFYTYLNFPKHSSSLKCFFHV